MVQQVNRLAASLEQAKAQAALSAAEYRRAQGVEAAGALSAEDIEKRRATSVTDAANVKVVAAQLAEAQARLARTRLVAPVDGTVLTRNAEVGQIANPGGDAAVSHRERRRGGDARPDRRAGPRAGEDRPGGHGVPDRHHAARSPARCGCWVPSSTRRRAWVTSASSSSPIRRCARGPSRAPRWSVDKAQRPVLPQTAVMADGERQLRAHRQRRRTRSSAIRCASPA